jgi:two-component SAPR family response regulator
LFELLRKAEYDPACEIIGNAINTTGKEDAFLVNLLTAAHKIVKACGECRSSAALHRDAIGSITQHEKGLRDELNGVLRLVAKHQGREGGETKAAYPKQPDSPEDRSGFGIGKRLQALLGRNRERPRTISGIRVEGSSLPGPSAVDAGASPGFHSADESATSKPRLAVYCLGPFQVYQQDELIEDWDGHKGTCILKYLVAHRKKSIAKDVIMDVLWPEADPDSARRNLHQAIYCLRQALRRADPGTRYIEFYNDRYNLAAQVDIWVDVEEFEEHVRAGRRLEAAGCAEEAAMEYGIAEVLYQGDFLEEDLYIDWPRPMRDRIRGMYLEAVDRLNQYYLQANELMAAIILCQKILAQDHCNENAHLRLMQCYLARGQRHLAVRQFHACRQVLKNELDLEPSEDIIRLYRSAIDVGA